MSTRENIRLIARTPLVFGCILEWQSVMYQVLGHCDLDLFSRIIVSGAYLLYYLGFESQIWCMDASLDGDISRTILGSL